MKTPKEFRDRIMALAKVGESHSRFAHGGDMRADPNCEICKLIVKSMAEATGASLSAAAAAIKKARAMQPEAIPQSVSDIIQLVALENEPDEEAPWEKPS